MSIAAKLRSLALNTVSDTALEAPLRHAYMRLCQPQAFRYDRQKSLIMQRVLNERSNCIDVGAYRGEVLEDFQRLAPAGRHFGFEPSPVNHEFLVRQFPEMTIHDVALSDTIGTATFRFVRSRPARSGLQLVEYPGDEEVDDVNVRVDTLDNVIPQDVDIDLIKIDVEGGEYAVLKGGRALIARCRPVIMFEHYDSRARSFGASSEELYDLITEEFGLSVSLMERWLAGEPGMTRGEFLSPGNSFEFIAHKP